MKKMLEYPQVWYELPTPHNKSASRIELSLNRCESSRPEPDRFWGELVVSERVHASPAPSLSVTKIACPSVRFLRSCSGQEQFYAPSQAQSQDLLSWEWLGDIALSLRKVRCGALPCLTAASAAQVRYVPCPL